MEIRIKINQKNNPYFAFMDFNDRLHPYYKHLLRAISSGNYTPKPQVEQKVDSGDKKDGEQQLEQRENKVEDLKDEEEDEDSDSDGEYELHPLLTGSRTSSSTASTLNSTNSSHQLTSSNGHTGSVSLIVSHRSENNCFCVYFSYYVLSKTQTLCMPYLAVFPTVLNYF